MKLKSSELHDITTIKECEKLQQKLIVLLSSIVDLENYIPVKSSFLNCVLKIL